MDNLTWKDTSSLWCLVGDHLVSSKGWSLAWMCSESGRELSWTWCEGRQDDRAQGGLDVTPWRLLRNWLGKMQAEFFLGFPHKRNNLRVNWERGRCGQLCGSLWWRCSGSSWLEEDVWLRSRQAWSRGWRCERRVGLEVRLGRSRVGRSRVGRSMLDDKPVLWSSWLERQSLTLLWERH